MGLLDSFRGKDDDDKRKANAASAKPRADFSDVTGASSTSGAAPAAPATAARTYTVVAGDSLSQIAKRELGDASKWKAIYEANRDKIDNPDLIHPGQVLNLPANS